ncbi:MAG: 4-(cytidine 5'-diphospho)-2-C-methyl-D-erythritol kinase [Betaproteobacteria bacterium]
MSLRSLLDVPAPAKLNLFLHVVGRRSDGYHLLESVFVLIDWADTLHFERREDGVLQRHDLGESLPPDDLCLRAARALQAASGTKAGADISVLKQVPSGAGMGGGSSDAATVLLALNRLWGLHWPRQRLLLLAATLGADVPFFVYGRNALVQGIGEQLSTVDVPQHLYAVVKPAASLPTADIFSSPLLKRDSASAILEGSLVSEALAWLAGPAKAAVRGEAAMPPAFGRNDLQPPAQARCSEVAQAARLLESAFGNSRMTGSGSAVFARVDTGVPPEATWPEALPSGWVGRLCRGLPQHPLRGWVDREIG